MTAFITDSLAVCLGLVFLFSIDGVLPALLSASDLESDCWIHKGEGRWVEGAMFATAFLLISVPLISNILNLQPHLQPQ